MATNADFRAGRWGNPGSAVTPLICGDDVSWVRWAGWCVVASGLVKPDFGVRSRSGALPARIGSMGPDLRVYRWTGGGTHKQQVPPVTHV